MDHMHPNMDFEYWKCLHCGLYIKGLTLGQGHDTPLGYEHISRMEIGETNVWF